MSTSLHPSPSRFVAWFRSVAPYIHSFRGKTFVIAFGGEVVADGKFAVLAQDINLLQAAGIRLVLIHGSRPQIEAQMKQRRVRSKYHNGLRITDGVALECVKEAVGDPLGVCVGVLVAVCDGVRVDVAVLDFVKVCVNDGVSDCDGD